LIADITFNRAGGGASQLWALSIANQVTGSLPACLPASGCAAPNGNICFEPEIMEIIWLPLHLNKSDPATMERERAGSNGTVKYSSQITSMQIYYYLGLRSKGLFLHFASAAPLFVAAPLVCNYSCCHVADSHTIVLQFSAAARGRAHTHTHSLSFEYKASASLFKGRKRTVSRQLTLSGCKYPNNAN
jgi:hypothetical protein